MSCSYDQEEFIDACFESTEEESLEWSNEAELIVVQSAGKPRPLTKFSDQQLVLKPLHKAMYDHLAKSRWLLRGPPTAEALKTAGFSERLGGVLVSGDYVSATDNLPISVAEAILSVALDNSTFVPAGVKSYAMRSLRPELYLEDGFLGPPSRGQMMGSLLSFPLLCCQNYAAFRWACRSVGRKSRNIPVLINGDDILFQSDSSFSVSWRQVISSLGFQVEVTKTSVDSSYGSLNSTPLRWSDGFLRPVPVLRLGMLRLPEFPNSLFRSFRSFLRGQSGPVRFRAAVAWFSWHRSILMKTRFQLLDLGFHTKMEKRCAKLAGLRGLVDEPRGWRLPLEPLMHNVFLDLEKVTMVPADSIPRDVEEANWREMASWKWSLRGQYVSYERWSKMNYWKKIGSRRPGYDPATLFGLEALSKLTDVMGLFDDLSLARLFKSGTLALCSLPVPRVPSLWSFLTPSGGSAWGRVAPLREARLVPVFDSVLDLYSQFEVAPPPYQEWTEGE
jgi:hypothetical protein